jgi:glutamyl-tRNA synthetase
LLETGAAYRCYCSAEELERKRAIAGTEGRRPGYDRTCRDRTDRPDSPFTVRFRFPQGGETTFHDLIRGVVSFQNTEIDDFIIARSDGTATYNFSVVVDDADMRISHVIRGEDHIANTPRQIQIYRAVGATEPAFAHVPLILGVDRSPLSKRHGATSVIAYRERGYFPEALVNYLARLGWAHGDQEIFSKEELIEKFRIEDVGASAGVFNPEKLEWVNFHYMKTLPIERLVGEVKPFLAEKGHTDLDDAWISKMVATLRERAKTLVELVELASFYFSDEVTIDPKAAAKFLKPESRALVVELIARLERLERWDVDSIRSAFEALMSERSLGLGKVAQPVRVAVTGGTVSPGIFEVLDVLGRAKTLARLRRAVSAIAA